MCWVYCASSQRKYNGGIDIIIVSEFVKQQQKRTVSYSDQNRGHTKHLIKSPAISSGHEPPWAD